MTGSRAQDTALVQVVIMLQDVKAEQSSDYLCRFTDADKERKDFEENDEALCRGEMNARSSVAVLPTSRSDSDFRTLQKTTWPRRSAFLALNLCVLPLKRRKTMSTIKDAAQILHNRRVKEIKPLIPPQILLEDIPLTLRAAETVLDGRRHTEAILRGDDDRLVVVVG